MGCVMVIEDDPAFLYLMTLVLTDEGYEVIGVSDGNEALKAIQTSEPDLILLDMQMPMMSGKAFMDAYYVSSGHSAPVVAMSGNPILADTVTSVVVEILLKPFDVDQLVDCVKKQISAISHDA